MQDSLPLSALISQPLVAFIIECDNEFERQVPHRTTEFGAKGNDPGAPWLVSIVMWRNFLQFVPEEGISIREWLRAARIETKAARQWLARFSQWWGYVTIEPPTDAARGKSPSGDWIVRPTRGGRKAMEAWTALVPSIEQRWEKRFGAERVRDSRNALSALANQMDAAIPCCLPILGYGLWATREEGRARKAGEDTNASGRAAASLPELLSKVLMAFAAEFEAESEVSLAICANVLRLAGDEGIRIAELPRVAGVSKEAAAVATKFLQARGFATIKAANRQKLRTLTSKGEKAREAYFRIAEAVESRWSKQYGAAAVRDLRSALERIVPVPGTDARRSLLFEGLKPHVNGWRAQAAPIEALPHFPMPLHRGGFPDGA